MPQLIFAIALVGAETLALKLAVLAVQFAYAKNQQRRAERRAISEYNAGLVDRLEMVEVQADAARTMALGRVRAVEGVRRKWASGSNSEKLTMIISFAGHRIDGFEKWYFNDTEVALDGSGWVVTEPYNKATKVARSQSLAWPGGTPTIALGYTPIVGSIALTWSTTEGGEGGEAAVLSVSGTSVTFNVGPTVGTVVTITYQSTTLKSTARIRPYLGAPGQNVGADLAAEYPGKIRSTDRHAGTALAVVDFLYDTDVYPQGRPNVTALFRGALCYDPRKDSTEPGGAGSHRVGDESTWQWSENSALCAGRYAAWRNGFGLQPSDMLATDIMAAADAADVSTVFTLRKADASTTTATMPRYRCGIVISSAADPRSSMAEILETMAGRSGWAGGVWRMRAGAMAAGSFTLTPDWLAQLLDADGQPSGAAPVSMSNGITRDQKVNRISGRCVDRDQRWQVLPFPAVQDAVLIAAEGEYPAEVEYQGVNHIAQAQHLASVAIREGQAALRIAANCNMLAYRAELFDVATLHLPRYGMTPELGKTAEVLGWRWHPTQGIALQLAEISAAIFAPLAELVGRDPAPNSALPPIGLVNELSITGITSGTEALTDGSVLTRTKVMWSASAQESIRNGGQIELQYTLAEAPLPADDWPSQMEQGTATSATLPGLLTGRWYVFRVRAIKPTFGVRGPWSVHASHQVALPPPIAGTYVDYVFLRADTAPATPTGAGLPAGWFGAPPAADGNPLYMSLVTKNSAGALVGAWSDPVRLDGADGAGTSVEYSVTGSSSWHSTFTFGDIYMRQRVGTGTWSGAIKIVGEDGTDGLDGADGLSTSVEYSIDGSSSWHSTFTGGDIYMRQRIGAGSWSAAIKIVGEDGDAGADGTYVDYVFKRSAGVPTTPSGTGTPAGWYGDPPAPDGNPLYMSKATKAASGALVVGWSAAVRLDGADGASTSVEYSVNGSSSWHSTFTGGDIYMRQRIGAGSWSAAIKIVGEDGDAGADGNYVDYVFRRASSVPTTPSGTGTPAGWYGDPPAPDGNPLYMSKATKDSTGALVVGWSAAVRLDGAPGSAGADGTDGAGLFTFVTRGGIVVNGGTVTRTSGSGWNADAYSVEGYTGGAYCSFQPGGSSLDSMMGLSTNPSGTSSFSGIDYAWYSSPGGTASIYESGTAATSHGSYTSSTVLSITYDDNSVRYFKDGVLCRTVTPGAGLKLFLDSSMAVTGNSITNARFGPMGGKGGDGAPGAAAINASLTRLVANFTADSTGLVDSGQSFATTMKVLSGATDETGSWTISRTSSDGSITTSISGATVTITGIGTGVETGTVTVTATRTSYPTQVIVVQVGKVKRAVPSAYPTAFGVEVATNTYSTTAALAYVRLNNNGTVETSENGSSWTSAGNWYLPTTSGIGSSYRAANSYTGDAPTGNSGVMASLSSGKTYWISALAGPGAAVLKTSRLIISIADNSTPTPLAEGLANLIAYSDRT